MVCFYVRQFTRNLLHKISDLKKHYIREFLMMIGTLLSFSFIYAETPTQESQKAASRLFNGKQGESMVKVVIQQMPAYQTSTATIEQLTERAQEFLQSKEYVEKIAELYANVYTQEELREFNNLSDQVAVLRHQELQQRLSSPQIAALLGQALFTALREASQKSIDSFAVDIQKVNNLQSLKDQSLVTMLNRDNFTPEVEASTLPVLIDVYAEWCNPCKRMEPILQQLSIDMIHRVKFAKFDVDVEKELAKRFSIQCMPTLLLFCDGKLKSRKEGFMDRSSLERWMTETLFQEKNE